MNDAPQDFTAMKTRLDEIAEEVSAEGISLDEALALYEEAVKLGLAACDVSEADILVPEDAPEEGAEVTEDAPAAVDGAEREDAAALADAVAVAEVVEAAESTPVAAVAEAAEVAEEVVEDDAAADHPEENNI